MRKSRRQYIIRSLSLQKNEHFFRQIKVFAEEVTTELISRIVLSMIAISDTFPQYTVMSEILS